MTIETVREDQRPLHHRTKDAIFGAMDELESPLFDYGPTEYVWVLTEVIRECAERIANRTGAA